MVGDLYASLPLQRDRSASRRPSLNFWLNPKRKPRMPGGNISTKQSGAREGEHDEMIANVVTMYID